MKILIIIDMLNGFCRKGNPLSLPNSTDSIEQEIETRVLEYRSKGDKVIFICDSHSFTDPEINNPYPPHCIKGTQEVEIIESLKQYAGKENTLTKNTLSIIHNTKLLDKIAMLNPTEIEITGVCTDICVLFAVYELRIRGYNVAVNSNCVLPLKTENQEFFLGYMNELLSARII